MFDRQYGPIEKIKRDHVNRYLFAAERVQRKKVLDLACGCGYGSWILHRAGNEVVGVDIEPEAIDYAREHYEGPLYRCQPAGLVQGKFDALVTFETLEHLEAPFEVFQSVIAPLVIASVPNEERYPFRAENFAGDKYPHKRHYTPLEFEQLLNSAGFEVTEKLCQQDKQHGEIKAGTDGRFLIYVAHKMGLGVVW